MAPCLELGTAAREPQRGRMLPLLTAVLPLHSAPQPYRAGRWLGALKLSLHLGCPALPCLQPSLTPALPSACVCACARVQLPPMRAFTFLRLTDMMMTEVGGRCVCVCVCVLVGQWWEAHSVRAPCISPLPPSSPTPTPTPPPPPAPRPQDYQQSWGRFMRLMASNAQRFRSSAAWRRGMGFE